MDVLFSVGVWYCFTVTGGFHWRRACTEIALRFAVDGVGVGVGVGSGVGIGIGIGIGYGVGYGVGVGVGVVLGVYIVGVVGDGGVVGGSGCCVCSHYHFGCHRFLCWRCCFEETSFTVSTVVCHRRFSLYGFSQ